MWGKHKGLTASWMQIWKGHYVVFIYNSSRATLANKWLALAAKLQLAPPREEKQKQQ